MTDNRKRLEQYDALVDDILAHGEIARNKNGQLILDENGVPMRVPPSAPMMGQIRAWLQERGAFKEAEEKTPHSQVRLRLAEQLQETNQ